MPQEEAGRKRECRRKCARSETDITVTAGEQVLEGGSQESCGDSAAERWERDR